MCGIVGGVGPGAPGNEKLQRQLDSIRHRGPDEEGTFVGQGIALGIARLSIIDVSTGQQPVSNQNKTIQLVFNGEIYNFKELRNTLESKGHRFNSQGDSEVLVHLYEEFGLDFVKLIKGMFAIAIWDNRDGSLTLVRDRVGKKPLWYAITPDNTLYFASEVKALLAAGVKTTLREGAVTEIMQLGYINAPLSAYNEIQQLAPATYGIWRNGGWSTKKYWSPDFESKRDITFQDALDETKVLIRAAVERRLISERPLGSFLSGGFDSTVVTAYMAQLMPEKVRTFSIGFTDSRFDESSHARAVAKYLDTEHIEEILNPDPAILLSQLAAIMDQPLADTAVLPTYMLAKFARQEVVVALGGDGGDEVFGGYDRYRAVPVMQKWNPLLQLLTPIGKNEAINSAIKNRKLKRIFSQLHSQPSLGHRYLSVMSASNQYRSESMSQEFLNGFDSPGARDDLSRMARSDFDWYLPGDLLVKADMATMANSLELRSPMLDHDLIEWAISLPTDFKIKGGETKHILKEVARSLVPRELIDRPKMGFAIPCAQWLRTGLKEMSFDLLTDSTAQNRGWFDTKEVTNILDDHMKGRDHELVIWPMLMLELWARTWLDQPSK
ncbi:MAG: asparagine synthase (glutamine-hydrolyzing) [Actinobacteria bacterium]|nr:asparagine synthase (glutamine-hydrolyzing) [Actinomycetota bacterium]